MGSNTFLRIGMFVVIFLLSGAATMVTSLPMPRGEMGPWSLQQQRPNWWGAVMTRGGGLFGGKDDVKKVVEEATGGGGGKLYPAMSQEEVEEWLEHIAVFAVTDQNGAGVILKPENDTSVFYFFLSPVQANATLSQLKSTGSLDVDLKVSAFSLGK